MNLYHEYLKVNTPDDKHLDNILSSMNITEKVLTDYIIDLKEDYL